MERPLTELKPKTRWVGRRLEVHRSVDSTNRVAEELAHEGAPEGTVVMADGQTAGRGRFGRTFFSPPGRSIYLSLLLRPEATPELVQRYIFVAAVAVGRVARASVPPRVEVEIKWPNDVLLDGRKTAGINLPVQLDGGRVTSAVLGVGLNVNLQEADLPAELRPIATSLGIANGAPLDRLAIAERLIESLEREIDEFRAKGFEQVLEAWLKFFRMRGERVRVRGPGVPEEIDGTVEGIDPDGALVLRTRAGRERVLTGDVTLAEKWR
jgi:BirA family biotin operon repressor/biotin-[acetyl-CoA-carboxylase] ligase